MRKLEFRTHRQTDTKSKSKSKSKSISLLSQKRNYDNVLHGSYNTSKIIIKTCTVKTETSILHSASVTKMWTFLASI